MPAGDGTGSYRDPGPPPPPDPVHLANLYQTVMKSFRAREMLGDIYDPRVSVYLDPDAQIFVGVDYGVTGKHITISAQLPVYAAYVPDEAVGMILQRIL